MLKRDKKIRNLMDSVPTNRNQAKRKAFWTMQFWLPIFQRVVSRIQSYEAGYPNWRFRWFPVEGPIYGGGLYVKAYQKMRHCPNLQLWVSVLENSRVSLHVGQEEIFSSDCSYPDNMCEDELEEAILLHFGI